MRLPTGLALMASMGWQAWSRFGKIVVGVYPVNDTELTVDIDYKDTWHVAIGAEYPVSRHMKTPTCMSFALTWNGGAN